MYINLQFKIVPKRLFTPVWVKFSFSNYKAQLLKDITEPFNNETIYLWPVFKDWNLQQESVGLRLNAIGGAVRKYYKMDYQIVGFGPFMYGKKSGHNNLRLIV